MRIVEIYKEPLGKTKDNLDPQTRNVIVTTAELASGDYVPESRNYTRGMSYTDIGQCVGLVRIAYWAAGICLDMWSPWATDDPQHPEYAIGSCGRQNLVQKHRITGTNGVSYFYDLANHLNILKSVRTTNDPLIGDIIFWDNTYDKNGNCEGDDNRTHVGIVKSGTDDVGTLWFIHATRRNGVISDRKMNIESSYKSNPKFNDYLRDKWTLCLKCSSDEICLGTTECTSGTKPNPCTQAQWDSVGKLSGELFSGFGTIRDVSCGDSTHQ